MIDVPDTWLHDAFQRLIRASEHLEEIKGEIAAYVETNEGVSLVKVEGQTATALMPPFPPPKIGVIIGEFVQNLRVSLDYLVYQLAILDSGKEVNGTQFPIVKDAKDFKGICRKYLGGVNEAHVAAIEALQPYKRPHWLWVMRGISNQDKHRTIQVLGMQSGGVRINVGGTEEEALAFGGFRMPGDDVAMYYPAPILVAFPDGTPVEEPLDALLAETRKVLEAFNPDFEGHVREVTVNSSISALPVALAGGPSQLEPPSPSKG